MTLHLTTGRTSATKRAFRCGAFTLVGPLAEGESRNGYLRHRCKAYACPVCGPKKLRKLRRGIGKVAQERKLTRLATLTLDASKIPPGKPSIEYLRNSWRKMRVSLTRHLGKPIEFMAVVELQKSGLAHLHVLVGAYLAQDWLSRAWQGVGGGRIVDIRWVDVHRVSAYLSKYLTDESLAHLPSGVRRFSCSKGIALWERKPKGPGWWLCKLSLDELRDHAKQPTDEAWQEEEQGVYGLVYFAAEPLAVAEVFKHRPRIKFPFPERKSRRGQ